MEKRLMLVSVTNKEKLVKLKPLYDTGQWNIISTGGTAAKLRELGMEVIEVSDFTGMEEMMDGRLKTLHPKVLGGILAVQSDGEHRIAVHQKLAGRFIDLVIVNFYNFADNPSIENIDIGGPTMARAAAKNHKWVTVVVDPNDYGDVVEKYLKFGHLMLADRMQLAGKVFRQTGPYDLAVADFFDREIAKFKSAPEDVFS